MTAPVDVVAAVIEARRDGEWKIRARVISVEAQVPAEHALIGLPLTITFGRTPHSDIVLKPGILFRVGIPVEIAEGVLDAIAAEDDATADKFQAVFEAEMLRPMAEPCVRIPLSLLKALRSQEPRAEASRQALLMLWAKDRWTGKKDRPT